MPDPSPSTLTVLNSNFLQLKFTNVNISMKIAQYDSTAVP